MNIRGTYWEENIDASLIIRFQFFGAEKNGSIHFWSAIGSGEVMCYHYDCVTAYSALNLCLIETSGGLTSFEIDRSCNEPIFICKDRLVNAHKLKFIEKLVFPRWRANLNALRSPLAWG